MPQIEIFTPTGVVSGTTQRAPLLSGGSDIPPSIIVERARWYPHDGSAPESRRSMLVASDDLMIVVLSEADQLVHMAWFSVAVELGPYRVAARLAMQPGFDPARALARPTGPFVTLRDLVIELRDRPEAGLAERPIAHVNRYVVDCVESTIMLGFFFPGAQFAAPRDLEAAQVVPAAAG